MLHRKILPAVSPGTVLVLAFLVLASLTAFAAADPALAAWTHKTRLTRTPEIEDYPKVAAAGCFVHVVWSDRTHHDLYYSRSTDAGQSWSAPVVLAANTGLPVLDSEIAASGRQVHVVWQQGAYDQASIHHRRSVNRGSSWRSPTMLSAPGMSSEQATLAVDGNNVHVAWLQTRRGSDTKPVKLLLAHSANRGKNWDVPRQLDRRSRGLSSPILAAGHDRLHLFWGRRRQSTRTHQILNRASADHGGSWSRRGIAVAKDGWRPWSVGINGDTVHLLWAKYQYKLAHVEYQRSEDAGQTWSAPQELDEGSVASLAVLGDGIEAVWARDWDGVGPLVYSRSRDRGRTWPIRRQIGRNGRFPALTLATGHGPCGGALHLTYGKHWYLDGGQLVQEIYYRRHPQKLE